MLRRAYLLVAFAVCRQLSCGFCAEFGNFVGAAENVAFAVAQLIHCAIVAAACFVQVVAHV